MTNKSELIEKLKNEFLQENEVELMHADNGINTDIEHIDPEIEEIWFMQCPKNIDVTQLIRKKIRFPGAHKVDQLEVVAKKFTKSKAHNFGYSSEHVYKMRQLPICGTVFVRNNLMNENSVLNVNSEASGKHSERPPLPDIKVKRHPLFGKDFDSHKISKAIQRRLKEADKNSTAITAASRKQKMQRFKEGTVEKVKTKKKHTATISTFQSLDKTADDLKWIENI